MKKSFFLFLILGSLLALGIRFGLGPLRTALGWQAKSGLLVTSVPQSQVFINGIEVGKTPYQDENLKAGEYEVKLTTKDATWRGKIRLISGTLSVVNRELAASLASSSGEIMTLYSGSGAVVTSTPGGATVEIDGQPYGKTPLSVAGLPFGGHTFILSKDSFISRSIRATSPKNLTLHLNVDLAVSEANLGNLAVPTTISEVKAIVAKTPTGFLRVRDKPSLSGTEIGRVLTGESLIILEELPGWMKIKFANGSEGYVASSYVQKQP